MIGAGKFCSHVFMPDMRISCETKRLRNFWRQVNAEGWNPNASNKFKNVDNKYVN